MFQADERHARQPKNGAGNNKVPPRDDLFAAGNGYHVGPIVKLDNAAEPHYDRRDRASKTPTGVNGPHYSPVGISFYHLDTLVISTIN